MAYPVMKLTKDIATALAIMLVLIILAVIFLGLTFLAVPAVILFFLYAAVRVEQEMRD